MDTSPDAVIQDLLAQYTTVADTLVSLDTDAQARITTLLSEDTQAQIAAIHAETAASGVPLAHQLDLLASLIKGAVIEYGHPVKGQKFQAIWIKGRVTWDDGFLQGYAATHEEILQARLEGNPSVTIRKRS